MSANSGVFSLLSRPFFGSSGEDCVEETMPCRDRVAASSTLIALSSDERAVRSEIREPHKGMPPLDQSGQQVSFFEFWPQRYFYAPMFFYWLWLTLRYGGRPMLPTVANPLFPMGGLIGEAKSQVFALAGETARRWIAPWVVVDRFCASHAMAVARAAGLEFPLIAKPDLGCRGVGVRRIRSLNDLEIYVESFPRGQRIVLQSLIDHEAEAGVFYMRRPGDQRGEIISLTLKYFPYVYGDGEATLRQLIERDARASGLSCLYFPRHRDRLGWVVPRGQPFRLAYAGSHSRGAIFRDGNHFVTEAMTVAFDTIAKDIREFYFGRFDIRFSTIKELQAGRGFAIVEINGAGAEATHIWDRRATLAGAYRALLQQYKTMWEIGATNARRGFRPDSLFTFIKAYRNEVDLWKKFPQTE